MWRISHSNFLSLRGSLRSIWSLEKEKRQPRRRARRCCNLSPRNGGNTWFWSGKWDCEKNGKKCPTGLRASRWCECASEWWIVAIGMRGLYYFPYSIISLYEVYILLVCHNCHHISRYLVRFSENSCSSWSERTRDRQRKKSDASARSGEYDTSHSASH